MRLYLDGYGSHTLNLFSHGFAFTSFLSSLNIMKIEHKNCTEKTKRRRLISKQTEKLKQRRVSKDTENFKRRRLLETFVFLSDGSVSLCGETVNSKE